MMIYIGNMPVARNIHALRRRKRISLARLAELTGIPYLTLYCIENGTLEDMDYLHLRALCPVLDVSMENLMEREV